MNVFHIFLIFVVGSSSGKLAFVPPESLDATLQRNTANGVVQGGKFQANDSSEFFGFMGIPFAAPPIGKRRFVAPETVDNWSGVLDASQGRDDCYQIGKTRNASEDCLYLNIYTPAPVNSTANLPVLVWYHGGGYIVGTIEYSVYGPQYFMTKGIVFVIVSYRLGIFGYLSTGDMACPGNGGLKDKIEALRWVNKNIMNFGGNPNDVTIGGESSGATDVSFMVLSRQTRGLFHGAIQESGSAVTSWSQQARARRIAFTMGAELGIFTRNSTVLLKRLQRKNALLLTIASYGAVALNLANPENGLPFAPVVEPEHPGAVLTEYSLQSFQKGDFAQVPILLGINSQESAVLQELITVLEPILATSVLLLPSLSVPADMNIRKWSRMYRRVYRLITRFYFGRTGIGAFNRNTIASFASDSFFYRPIIKSAELMEKYTKVYFYEFCYEGVAGKAGTNFMYYQNLIRNMKRYIKGVGHTEELWYLFDRAGAPLNSEDYKMMEILTTLWTNFVKFKDPTEGKDKVLQGIKWPSLSNSSENHKYLKIDTKLEVRENPKKERVDFWFKLYDKFSNPPYNTY